MVYGSNADTQNGYLKFATGKKVKLSEPERMEFENWIRSRILADREKQEILRVRDDVGEAFFNDRD